MLSKLATPIVVAVIVIGVALGAQFVLNQPVSTVAMAPTATPLILSTATASTPTTAPTLVAKSVSRAPASSVKATGNLISASQAALAFQSSGRVKTIHVKEGDRVKTGALLVSLDTSLLDLQVAQAQAALDLAKANFDRIKAGPTVDDYAIAKSNLDRAKAALEQAQAAFDRVGGDSNPFIALAPQSLALQQATSAYQAAVAQFNLTVNHPTDTETRVAQAQVAQAQAALDLAKQSVVNASLVAPFDGTVVSIIPKLGESVAPSAPVVTLADLTRMQVQVNLDENTLASIRVGQSVTLSLDVLGNKALTGRVTKIALLGTGGTGMVSVPVTIDIDSTDSSIYPGLSATVEFQSQP